MATPQRDWRAFVLLLVDVQQDFWSEARAQSFPDFPANITKLLTLCRQEGIEIVHLRASFQPDQSDWMERYKLLGRIPCIEGTAGVETLPCALEEPHEVVLRKQTFDGFYNPPLLQYLHQTGKRFVLVAGLITSTCVLFTATSAAQSGFLVELVEDCCADEPMAHAHTLSRYRFIFERTTVEMIPHNHAEWVAALKQLAEKHAR
jgi:nicotinamidase-related amidase